MTIYKSPQALRTALEHRLLTRSLEAGIGLDRLRLRVLVERVLARFQAAEPEQWVLKGGMALEVRLRDEARLTKDLDLGLRDKVADSADLHERLIDALSADPDRDGFVVTAGVPSRLSEDGGGHLTWRAKIVADLAGKPFGSIHLDVSPRAHELDITDRLMLPNSLEFAGIRATEFEIVDVHRHAAEKFHAMSRDFGDRENTRVRDLVDLVILIEHRLLTPAIVAAAVRIVWAERDAIEPPGAIAQLPNSWVGRYERIAAEHDMDTRSFPAAIARVTRLWVDMFPNKET